MEAMRASFKLLSALLTAALLLSMFYAVLPRPRGLSMAVEFNDHAAACWVASERGFFNEEGLDVECLKSFRTGLELAAAMARGEVDVAWVCLAPAVLMFSKGVPIKVVAATHRYGYAIVARPGLSEAPATGVAACPGKGSPCYLLLMIFMEERGVNYTVKYLRPDLALNALATGQVDVAALPEHYATLAVEREGCRLLAISEELWPGMVGSVLVVRGELIEERPGLVEGLVKATAKATALIKSNLTAAAEVVAEKLGITLDEALAFHVQAGLRRRG